MKAPMDEQMHFDFRGQTTFAQGHTPASISKKRQTPPKHLNSMSVFFDKPVNITYTQNRSTMLSFKEEKHEYKLRLHEGFLHASEEEISTLADYLRNQNKTSGRVVDAMIDRIVESLPAKSIACTTKGRFFDLQVLFENLNRKHFHGQSKARITWGKAQRKRYRKSIQLGLYYYEDNLIVIHPALDQSFVPEHYISWVVYHEMLHEVLGCETKNGRRKIHPPEFVVLEESFPSFAISKQWEEQNLHRLLRYQPNNR